MGGRSKRRSRRRRDEGRDARRDTPRHGRIVGELSLHRDGYGFVIADSKEGKDVFIPARYIGDALHTDLVEADVMPGRGGKLEGRIRRIVERRVKTLMGRLERSLKFYQVIADDKRVRHRILVPDDATAGARQGDNVVVEITRYPSGEDHMAGRVVSVLGKRGDVKTEVAAVVIRHSLPAQFPSNVLAEARRVRDSFYSGGHGEGRVDLRGVPFVTIDGEDAKDFDDAVAVKRAGGGKIVLLVSIADVSHFVRPGSALDKEAFARGTSVYFPGECIPMLPFELSNDICSLRPNEDRFTITAEMEVDGSGNIAASKFYRSVIKSKERMTYTSMKKILVEGDAREKERYSQLIGDFMLMRECYERLRKRRKELGSIDFDLPEPEIIMDMKGGIQDIVRADRHIGHMMIEEFMIAANEAVASFLTEKRAGCIYRAHEPPPADSIKEFNLLLYNLGYKIKFPKAPSPKRFAEIIEMVKGRPEERLVNHMMLRTMSQAVYSEKNLGHYGLASGCYCHFTSPIRRYPDLIVHRLMGPLIEGGGKGFRADLSAISDSCSRRERIAMEAEREIAKLYAAMFMQEKMGEEYDGIVSHVTKFGFFVELIDYFVEGLVHIESLDGDKFRYLEEGHQIVGKRQKRRFRIGDKVRVEVEDVDVAEREVWFSLVE
jgi:ribonuclease R